MLLIHQQNVQSANMYRKLLAIMLFFWLVCATVRYGSQNFSGLHKKENVPNRSSAHLELLLCSVEVYFKYVIHNYFL